MTSEISGSWSCFSTLPFINMTDHSGCCFSAPDRHAWRVENAFVGDCSGGIHSSNDGDCLHMLCSGDCRISRPFQSKSYPRLFFPCCSVPEVIGVSNSHLNCKSLKKYIQRYQFLYRFRKSENKNMEEIVQEGISE